MDTARSWSVLHNFKSSISRGILSSTSDVDKLGFLSAVGSFSDMSEIVSSTLFFFGVFSAYSGVSSCL
jgi:hypothetical protein